MSLAILDLLATICYEKTHQFTIKQREFHRIFNNNYFFKTKYGVNLLQRVRCDEFHKKISYLEIVSKKCLKHWISFDSAWTKISYEIPPILAIPNFLGAKQKILATYTVSFPPPGSVSSKALPVCCTLEASKVIDKATSVSNKAHGTVVKLAAKAKLVSATSIVASDTTAEEVPWLRMMENQQKEP